MDANNLGFPDHSFDFVLAGFIAWDYCYDFFAGSFIATDTRSAEIHRVLKEGGHVLISSWALQEDIHWLEGQFKRYLPEYTPDRDAGKPIVYSRETSEGYKEILKRAGFRDIHVIKERVDFVSPDEDTWWRMMRAVGWWKYLDEVVKTDEEELELFRHQVFQNLQQFKDEDGIHFAKQVFIIKARR